NPSYWSKAITHRLSRRRVILISSAAAMSAAFLAACGGSNNDSNGSNKSGGLLFKPADSSSKATKGGVMQNFMTAGVEHFDQVTGNFIVQAHTDHTYSRLIRFKVGTLDKPPEGEVEPDVA